MQIGNKAMLAVELMAWLRSCNRVRPGKTIWLADRIQHSVSYTESLLARLRDTGLITSKKGAGGGYYLSRPPEAISVAEILAAFDSPQVEVTGRVAPSRWTADRADASRAVDDLCFRMRDTALRFLGSITLASVDERACLDAAASGGERTERRAATR